jgi:hypothetical protein
LKSHELIYRSIVMTTRRPSSLRCSRPLCSSQSTNSTPPPTTTVAAGKACKKYRTRPESRCPVPQDPTTCTRPAAQPPLSPHLTWRTHGNQLRWRPVICSTHELTSTTRTVMIWRLEDPYGPPDAP